MVSKGGSKGHHKDRDKGRGKNRHKGGSKGASTWPSAWRELRAVVRHERNGGREACETWKAWVAPWGGRMLERSAARLHADRTLNTQHPFTVGRWSA